MELHVYCLNIKVVSSVRPALPKIYFISFHEEMKALAKLLNCTNGTSFKILNKPQKKLLSGDAQSIG